MDNTSKVLFAALVGAAAGAVAGIMLAPDSGEETRKKVKKSTKKFKKDATRSMEDLAEKGNEVIDGIKKKTESILSAQ